VRRDRSRRPGGFTLLEILIVITIITILMALLVVLVKGVITRAREAKTVAIIEILNKGCEDYKNAYNTFPRAGPHRDSANLHYYLGCNRKEVMQYSQDGNHIVVAKPPFLEFRREMLVPEATNGYPDPPSEIVDAWGRPVHYKNPGEHNKRGVDIWSDGVSDKDEEDDLGNWPH